MSKLSAWKKDSTHFYEVLLLIKTKSNTNLKQFSHFSIYYLLPTLTQLLDYVAKKCVIFQRCACACTVGFRTSSSVLNYCYVELFVMNEKGGNYVLQCLVSK